MGIEIHAGPYLKGDYVEFAWFDNYLSIIYNDDHYHCLKVRWPFVC